VRRAVCNLNVCRKVNRQYKHNLSCTVHDHRCLYRRIQSDDIAWSVSKIFTGNATINDGYNPSAFHRELQKYLLEMPLSPALIPMDTVRWHLSAFQNYQQNN